MSATTNNKNDLINATIEHCDRMLNRLKTISETINEENKKIESGLYVDTLRLTKMTEEARILRKRIYENIATINSMSDNIVFTNEEYIDYTNKLNRNAVFIESNLFDMIERKTIFKTSSKTQNVVFRFRNSGFAQWNKSQVVLKLTIFNNITQIKLEQFAYMQEDTASTGDIASFLINELIMPSVRGVYDVSLELMDIEDNYVYCSVQTNNLDVAD